MGNVDNIKEEMQKSKIFVLSSDYEGMPNVLMEAMALGLICVSTDCPCGGPRFLINNEIDGFLFKVQDKHELVSIVEKILLKMKDEELAEISKNARNKVIDFSEEKINAIWYEYIKKIAQL